MTMGMKLMEFAEFINDLDIGETIDFAPGTQDEVEQFGFWCGVKRIDEFDNDNPMYLVSHYGGEAYAELYHLSEYDHNIGNFCAPRLAYRLDGANRKRKDWVECCARMIADYLETYGEGVTETITVEWGLW